MPNMKEMLEKMFTSTKDAALKKVKPTQRTRRDGSLTQPGDPDWDTEKLLDKKP